MGFDHGCDCLIEALALKQEALYRLRIIIVTLLVPSYRPGDLESSPRIVQIWDWRGSLISVLDVVLCLDGSS